MRTAVVTFYRCIQDSQEYGSDDEYMYSRVFFALEIGEKLVGKFYADLKQTVGSSHESGSIEVSPPHGYDGPWNHQGFSGAATAYFGGLVGSQDSAVRIAGGRNIRMHNNVFNVTERFTFQIPG